MDNDLIKEKLKNLNGWIHNKEKKSLEKDFFFKSYLKTISFVNAIAWLANKENHHPDFEISFGKCKVCLTTHDESGLTQKDFDLAKKINDLEN